MYLQRLIHTLTLKKYSENAVLQLLEFFLGETVKLVCQYNFDLMFKPAFYFLAGSSCYGVFLTLREHEAGLF